MPYDLGDTIRLTGECRDPAGELATAATATLTITHPDGTTTSPTVPAPTQTGVYVVDYVTAQAGRHTVRWQWTGPAAAYLDAFDVTAADDAGIVSLAETRRQLKLSGTDDDEDLRRYIASATEVVEYFSGACVRRTYTEEATGGRCVLSLGRAPVISLTSATPILAGAPTVDLDDLDVSPNTGIVRSITGTAISCGPLRVTYVAGRTVVPDALILAAQIIVKHLWETRRGTGGRGQLAGDDTTWLPRFGFAIPNRAMDLMRVHPGLPGIA